MRKRYWAVAYAHVIRWAGPCRTEEEAIFEAFGDTTGRATVIVFPSNPKYLSVKAIRKVQQELAVKHEALTGHKISI